MQQNIEQIPSGDIGVDVEIDTELTDFAGYTTKKVQFYFAGALIKEEDGADGGDGPVGRLLTYTTTQDNHDTDKIFHDDNIGEWELRARLANASVNRRSDPPLKVITVSVPT